MSFEREIRTSLEVGFPGGELPEAFLGYRGKAMRAVPVMSELPYEDAQFDVVMLHSSAVSRKMVKEAHRVLKPEGSLFFTVAEKTSKQPGYTMPDIYSVVRDGFHIANVSRPAWWYFGRRGRTITIRACKKTWKEYKGFVRAGSLPFSPFRSWS